MSNYFSVLEVEDIETKKDNKAKVPKTPKAAVAAAPAPVKEAPKAAAPKAAAAPVKEAPKAAAPKAAPAAPVIVSKPGGLTITRKPNTEVKPEGKASTRVAADADEYQMVASANPRKTIQRETVIPREGKRQYDRKDGTGRAHDGLRKGGAGKGNWGKAEDAIVPIEEKEATTPASSPAPATDAAVVAPVDAAAAPVVDEPKQKTYEEYLAAQKAIKPALKAPKTRVAGEGEKVALEKKWGETITLNVAPAPAPVVVKEEKKVEKPATEEKKKQVAIPITQVFSVVAKPIDREERPPRGGPRDRPQATVQPQQPHKAPAKSLALASKTDFPELPGHGKK